jgi:hypothetical protein
MAKVLDQASLTQISQQNINAKFIFKINGVAYTSYLMDWSISYNTQFGSASATFTLNNNTGYFGSGGTVPLNIGDVVELIEQFVGSSTQWKSFYGKIEQRTIKNAASDRTISLTCLDYISVLKQWDIDLVCEGTRVQVTNETLQPQFLPSPNQMFAQIFNFANDAIADNPRPIFTFKDKNNLSEDPQFDGFDVYYDVGQVKLGAPLQALDNYDFVAKSYFFYTIGIQCEDVLEQLLTQPDGYGGYLFGEATAAAVIANHLTTTFNAEEGTSIDVLTPNYTTSTVDIKYNLVNPISAGDTSIYVSGASSLPTTGQGSINGDIFTWTDVQPAGIMYPMATYVVSGIPSSGAYSLSVHSSDAKMKYTGTYASGRVWYLKYSNVTTTLYDVNFTIPGATLSYFDKRNGRIILNTNINLLSTVTCDVDYTFKTLQATGVELNYISFRPRELNNRYDAIEKVRKYLAPNYIIRTQGDDKIWSSYMYQRVAADYTLNLIEGINYLEDDDLYTRVVMYGKNKNPTNLMFTPNIGFGTSGASYKAFASQVEMVYDKTENGFHYFISSLSNTGRIDVTDYTPKIYIGGETGIPVPIDNKVHQLISQPIKLQLTTRTETTTTGGETGSSGSTPATTTTNTYYYYRLYLPHQGIESSQNILVYDLYGNLQVTVAPHDPNMDYANGVYAVPGGSQNSLLETLSTASYWIFYSTGSVSIDYDNVIIKINKILIPDPLKIVVLASFNYWAIFTPARDVISVIDGKWDTQVQTVFYADVPSGYEYATVDFGSIFSIQAMDLVGGFYKPDDIRKFDIDFRFTLQYSIDGTNFYEIGEKTHNIQMTGGASVSFEEEDLGIGFQARYIKIILENVKKVEYGSVTDASGTVIRSGIWVVAMSEIAAYGDIILKSESKLIATTTLTDSVGVGDTVVNVVSTTGFTEPGSGETATAYINGLSYKTFSYTGLTTTSFTGVTTISGCSGLPGDIVTQTVSSSISIYDNDNLLPNLGDRLYKEVKVDDSVLFTQTQLDSLTLAYLKEFYKNHSKLTVDILFTPYMKMGQTVKLTDSYNYITNGLYFIEGITNKNGIYQLQLGKYPA